MNTDPYRPFLIVASLLALVTVLAIAKAVFLPFALSILLSFALTPPVRALQARGLRRTTAVMSVALTSLLLLGGVFTMFVIEVRQLVADLPSYRANLVEKFKAFRSDGPSILDN